MWKVWGLRIIGAEWLCMGWALAHMSSVKLKGRNCFSLCETTLVCHESFFIKSMHGKTCVPLLSPILDEDWIQKEKGDKRGRRTFSWDRPLTMMRTLCELKATHTHTTRASQPHNRLLNIWRAIPRHNQHFVKLLKVFFPHNSTLFLKTKECL